MRTTIDLPLDLRRKLAEEAAARNLKGYSPVIVEALRAYFESRTASRPETVARLRGSLLSAEYESERERRDSLRGNWRV